MAHTADYRHMPTSKRTRNRRRPLNVHLQELTFDCPGIGTVTLPVHVDHRLDHFWGGLADPAGIRDPLSHTFDLILDAEMAMIGLNDGSGALWERFVEAYRLPHAPDLVTAESMVIARLQIGELPSHIVEQGGGWLNAADDAGETLRYAIELVERLAGYRGNDDEFALALIDGALLWPQKLGVHPAFRGRRLGLSLLAHGLWALHRAEGDAAILEAAPIQTWFDAMAPAQDPAGIGALCTHYGRLGFRRWLEDQSPESPGGSIMFSAFGTAGIRARGLGELSHIARLR